MRNLEQFVLQISNLNKILHVFLNTYENKFYEMKFLFQLLNAEDCIHAVGQGAIAIECRQNDEQILDLIWPLAHFETTITCIAERALMRTLVSYIFIGYCFVGIISRIFRFSSLQLIHVF